MVCGASDLACHVISWVAENSGPLKDAVQPVAVAWESAMGPKGWALAFLKEHGEKSIAAASLAFAAWRWWAYREAILHKRLGEYIAESDARLEPTSKRLVEAILRPAPLAPVAPSKYSVELARILETERWDRDTWRYRLGFAGLDDRTNWRLGSVLSGIKKRLATTQSALRSLNHQQAQLHMIAGAIAAAKAAREKDSDKAKAFGRKALREFQMVQKVPGHEKSIDAKENEAFQLMRLGRRVDASKAYEELEEFAKDTPDVKIQDFIQARASRFQAQIQQVDHDPAARLNSWIWLAPAVAAAGTIGALLLRDQFRSSMDGWQLLEQAEIHYVAAYIANRNNFVVQEPQQRALALSTCDELLETLPKRSIFIRQSDRRLKRATNKLRSRIVKATEEGTYDLDWLRMSYSK